MNTLLEALHMLTEAEESWNDTFEDTESANIDLLNYLRRCPEWKNIEYVGRSDNYDVFSPKTAAAHAYISGADTVFGGPGFTAKDGSSRAWPHDKFAHWCTSSGYHFDRYVGDGKLYCFMALGDKLVSDDRQHNYCVITDNTGKVKSCFNGYERAVSIFDLIAADNSIVPLCNINEGRDGAIYIGNSAIANANKNESLTEALNDNLPTILNSNEILEFIRNIPKSAANVPPQKFTLGYMTNVKPAAKYAGGRGSTNKETGEVLPRVQIIKCSEYSNCYAEAWTDAGNTKDLLRSQNRTAADVGSRRGFHSTGERSIFDSDLGKGLAFGALLDSNAKTKTKYFISINGADFVETTKEEVAQYMPNPEAFMTPREYAPANEAGQRTQTFLFSGIYLIGSLGRSIF